LGFRSYVITKTLMFSGIIIGISVLMFVLARALPGDPARLALGPNATQQQVEDLRRIWGLDQPIYIQYFSFIKGFVVGNWGISIRTRNDVFYDVSRLVPATLELTIVSMIFSILVGVPLGVVSATKKDKWEDHAGRILSLAGVSLPQFWTGIILQVVLASWLALFPIQGRLDPTMTLPARITGMYILDSLLTGNWPVFWNAWWHVLLPAFVLSFPQIANISRLTRTSMIDQVGKDYITLLSAYGLPKAIVQYKYMLKNAFNATLTIIALSFGYSLAAAVVVEAVFAWPGMGLYLVTSIVWKDLNAITGSVLVVGIAIVIATLVLEVLRGYLDPRIRFGELTR